jgi:hypothetical protein
MHLTAVAKRVLAVVVLAASLSSPALAQTFLPGGQLIVRDANNQTVGELISDNKVSVIINGHAVSLGVNRLGLGDDGNTRYFDQPGCHGNVLIDWTQARYSVTTPFVFAPDGTMRIAPVMQPSSVLTLSYYNGGDGCVNAAALKSVLATEAGPDVGHQFVAPFSVAPVSLLATAQAPILGPTSLVGLLVILLAVGIGRLKAT